jgi:hypothetical protein
VPEGAVTLPTPEQERKAILALMGFFVLGVFGIVSVIGGAALAIIKLAQWVWGIS